MSYCSCDKHPHNSNLQKDLFGLRIWVTVQQEHKAAEREASCTGLPLSTYSPGSQPGNGAHNGRRVLPTGVLRVTPDSVKVTTNTNCNSALIHLSTNTLMITINQCLCVTQ